MNEKNFYQICGEKLKELRRLNKLTQEELAKILEVSKTAIVNYENGNRKIPLEIVVKLANLFNVSVDSLVGRTSYSMALIVRWSEVLGDEFLTYEEGEELINYAKYLLYRREDKK